MSDTNWLQRFGWNLGRASSPEKPAPSKREERTNNKPNPALLVGAPGSPFEPGVTAGFTLKEHAKLPFTKNWDPRDYEWAPPSDEDEPWATKPDIASSTAAFGSNGSLKGNVVTSAVEALTVTIPFGSCKGSRCPICLDDHTEEETAVAFECGQHYYCTACAVRLIEAKVQGGEEALCVECEKPCPALVAQQLVKRRTFDKYLVARLTASGNMQRCPACQTYCYSEGRDLPPSTRCPCCETRFCRSCACQWNSKHICQESKNRHQRRERRQASRRFAQVAQGMGLKKCPNCGVACEKADDGCDHLICIYCRFHFCWTCLADMQVVFNHGNHYHHESCIFFYPYTGKDRIRVEKNCQRCIEAGKPCVPPSEKRTNTLR